jgi:hypothetical protein
LLERRHNYLIFFTACATSFYNYRVSPGTAYFLWLESAEPGLFESVFILPQAGVNFQGRFQIPIACQGLTRTCFYFLGGLYEENGKKIG